MGNCRLETVHKHSAAGRLLLPLLLLPGILSLLLLPDKDLLQLGERLVPRLRQGDQGKGCPKKEGAGVEEEYALHADQAGQIRECLRGIGVK